MQGFLNKQNVFISLLLGFALCSSLEAMAAASVTLQQVLEAAQSSSESVRSLQVSLRAAENEIRSRELELSPKLTADLSYGDDQRESTTKRGAVGSLSSSLSKLFASGTTVALSAGNEIDDYNNSVSKTVATWEAKVTQSLLRNSFGQATSLRRASDQAELQARRRDLQYRLQALLVTIEGLYWDFVLSSREEVVRVANLQRSELLETWTRKRLRLSAAESTDLMQVQALTSSRRLDLDKVRNQLQTSWAKIATALPGALPANATVDLDSLERDRNLAELLAAPARKSLAANVTPARLDALASRALANQSRNEAERVGETLRPALDVFVSHGRDGTQSAFGDAWGRAESANHTATKAGISFSMDLDGRLKDDRRIAAQLTSEARSLDAKLMERTSADDWRELLRTTDELKRQIRQARELADFQKRKLAAERTRYQLGRATAFELTAFEVDASEAELQVYRLLTDLRKTESRARLFTGEEG